MKIGTRLRITDSNLKSYQRVGTFLGMTDHNKFRIYLDKPIGNVNTHIISLSYYEQFEIIDSEYPDSFPVRVVYQEKPKIKYVNMTPEEYLDLRQGQTYMIGQNIEILEIQSGDKLSNKSKRILLDYLQKRD